LSEGLERLNGLSPEQAEAELLQCCGSTNWAQRMVRQRPFSGIANLLEKADRIWWELGAEHWHEAFRRHPKIGEKSAAETGSTQTHRWSEKEQAAARTAGGDVLAELAEANRAYQERFGYIFIVCATGKSGEEMLALLRNRLQNDPDVELRIAAEEQRRITRLRLEKLLRQE